MVSESATYPECRFPAEVIRHATICNPFGLLRDIELILVTRGVAASYERLRRWCFRYGADLAARLR